MNLYHLCIAVAPKKIRREMPYPTGVPVFAGSPPRPRHASGNLRIPLPTRRSILLSHTKVTRSAAPLACARIAWRGRYRSWWRSLSRSQIATSFQMSKEAPCYRNTTT